MGSVSFLEPYHNSYFNLSYRALEDILLIAGLEHVTIEAGVTGIVLIWARIFGLLGSRNLKLFSLISRIIFPVKYLIKIVYWALRLKNRLKGRDLGELEKNINDHYEALALSISGHILFTALKKKAVGAKS